jgi:hypothetical protein
VKLRFGNKRRKGCERHYLDDLALSSESAIEVETQHCLFRTLALEHRQHLRGREKEKIRSWARLLRTSVFRPVT